MVGPTYADNTYCLSDKGKISRRTSRCLISKFTETFADQLAPGRRLPRSRSLALKLLAAKRNMEGGCVTDGGTCPVRVDVCRNGCVLFMGEFRLLDRCPVANCRETRYRNVKRRVDGSTIKQPWKQVIVRSLIARLREMMSTDWLRPYMRNRTGSTDGSLRDVYDASLYREVMVDLKQPFDQAIYLSTDGASIGSWNGASYYPVVATFLNLPVWLRDKFEMSFASAFINGKPSSEEMQAISLILADELSTLEKGILVERFDANGNPVPGGTIRLRARFVLSSTDLRADSLMTCRTQAPATFGACP